MLANEDMARVESEAGIIATLIHHPDFSYYSEQLLPNHFTNEENRYIYQAICSLARDGIERIDPYNIIQALTAKEATRRFADELSIDQLYTLMENSENISRNTVEEYKLLVNNVMDAAFRRDTYQQLKECPYGIITTNRKSPVFQGFSVIRQGFSSFSNPKNQAAK